MSSVAAAALAILTALGSGTALAATTTTTTTTTRVTHVGSLNPFNSDGTLRTGWTVNLATATGSPVNCAGTAGKASPAGKSAGTHWCGTTAQNAFACWAPPTYPGRILCVNNPWPHRLRALRETGLTHTAKPTSANPLAVQLYDGSRWQYRIGGAAGGRADHLYETYYCIAHCPKSTAKGAQVAILTAPSDKTPITMTGKLWTAKVGLVGNPQTHYPAPRTMDVQAAYFMASTFR